MNRAEAKRIACAGEISLGELRGYIRDALRGNRMSRVNPSIEVVRAAEIYMAALGGRSDDERPAGMMPDPYKLGRMRRTRDSLTIENILRDCA